MKKIEDLPKDIYNLFVSDIEFTDEEIKEFSDSLARMLASRVQEKKEEGRLRMSMLGLPYRKLWYSINRPDLGEPLDGKTRFKFLYGDLIEHLVLFLAKKSGHTVYDGQESLDIDGVAGHRDAIVDGVTTDVKSASPFGFKKFARHELEADDPFGYIDQVNAYRYAGEDDPRITEKDKIAFLAIEKVMGDIVVDVYDNNKVDYRAKIAEIREMLSKPVPPDRCYPPVVEANGNESLGIQCSYCDFKRACWPTLRAFQYSTGPKFFTKIKKPLRVEEAKW